MGIFDWSTTPSSNATVGSINWAEGQAPSTVNNSARQEMADVAAWRDLISGAVGSTGSANVYALTSGTSVPALVDGLKLTFQANFTNTGAATLNVDGLGAKSLRYQSEDGDAALHGGVITNGNFYDAVYSTDANSAAGGWIVLNPSTVRGTWTPAADGGTTTTYGANNGGWYRREGDLVTFGCILQITSIGDGSTAGISGLPYASQTTGSVSVGFYTGLRINVVDIGATVTGASSSITLVSSTAAAASMGVNAVLQDGSTVYISGSYLGAA